MFNCTVIENNKETLKVVFHAWDIPKGSIKVEHDTKLDVDAYLHLKAKYIDMEKQLAEFAERVALVEEQLCDMEQEAGLSTL